MERGHRKVCIGILTTAIMVSNCFAPFAASPVAGSGIGKDGNVKGTGSVEGIVSEDIYNVVLPTVPEANANTSDSTTYAFILDPQKLAADKNPDESFVPADATLFFKNKDGIYRNETDSFTIENKSTMSVDVKLNAAITGMGNAILTNDSTFVDDNNSSVYLALTDSNGKESAVDKYGAFLQTTLAGNEDAYEVVYDAESNKYKYELKSDEDIAASGIEFVKYNFRLSDGACNSANDWSELADSLSPELKVTWDVSPRPKNLAPSIGKTSYIMTKNIANNIEVDLGCGDLAATDIKSIVYKELSGAVATLPTANYRLAGGTLTFDASYITSLIEAGVASRSYTVTFNDAASTQENVMLAMNDAPPSIVGDTAYTMLKGQPVLVDVDLGVGNLCAKGIKSITFERNVGGTGMLVANDDYIFADGVLKFRGVLINKLLSAGITARDYVITFDDKAGTQKTITLTADGSFPSISANAYTAVRDMPVSVDVNLGSGDLGATDIQSITCVNKAGSIVTLSETDQYTFDGSVLTFNASYINTFIAAGNESREYTITFNDIAKTQAVIQLDVEIVDPSLDETSYTMYYGQPVLVDIDLGTGSSQAAGIKSIEFERKVGGIGTLVENDDYIFADGVLKFRGVLISRLLNAGVLARDYVITFNDKAGTQKTVTLIADGSLPSVSGSAYEAVRNTPVSIAVDLGSGDLGATGIQSITCINKAGNLIALSGTDQYTFDGSVLTFNASYINTFIAAGNVQRNYTITFNNKVQTRTEILLNTRPEAPIVGDTSYTMVGGQPILVDIDLGAGNLRANGIKSITFERKVGGIGTLAENDDYIFADGVLKFRGVLINRLLSAGIEKREYTIVLDDKAATQGKVTLTANGKVPSITTTSYEIVRNNSVSVAINLGSGDLGAKGIQSITCINKVGNLIELSATNQYSFRGNVLTINASYINSFIAAGNVSRKFTVIFDNIAKTQVEILLNVKPEAPKLIGNTSYTMTKGVPVLVNIDLGAGNLQATGIKSITFQRKVGGIGTLTANNDYIFTNGELKFRGVLITQLFNAGIATRDYTITLNDKAGTHFTVTLKK